MKAKEKKHKIISMSLTDDFLAELDNITKEIGFSGRSETIRAGIKTLREEQRQRSKLKGKINATLSVVHYHAKNIGRLAHDYQDIITSHLHNHLDNDKCLDIFILKGNSELIRNIVDSFQKHKGIGQVKLIVC